ncbi:MAG: DUF6308 family protein [Candidatus Eisenbacteria bacterium]
MSRLRLSNDHVITNPEQRIREYCRVEVYSGYDDCHEVNNVVSAQSITAANRIIARIGGDVGRRIQLSESIKTCLAGIDNRELGEMGDDEWDDYRKRIHDLLLIFCSIKGVGLAVATKISHLKRPELIPILDSFVVRFLLGIDTGAVSNKARLVKIGAAAIDAVREDIRGNWKTFVLLQQSLSDLPIHLGKVRLYDILVWSTEKWDVRGTLTAPYGKPETSVVRTSSADAPYLPKNPTHSTRDDVAHPDWVEIKSEEEFNTIRVGRAGYVVITDKANPNKMHRLSCPYLQLTNFREKVITNKCKNGRYFWTSDPRLAQEKCGAQACSKCEVYD